MTLKIPFANLACVAATAIVFREELMGVLRPMPGLPVPGTRTRFDRCGRLAMVFLSILFLAMLRRIPMIGGVHKPAYAILWCVGIAQDYQLFNWIDRKNIYAKLETWEHFREFKREKVNPRDLFPRSIRSVLLQSYLYNVRWIKVPEPRSAELKQAIFFRFARRYCHTYHPKGTIWVNSTLQRITLDNLELNRGLPTRLMVFRCAEGNPELSYLRLNPRHPANLSHPFSRKNRRK